jgi:hypothetical protein
MTSKFRRVHPLEVPVAALFEANALSPTEAGREDAQAAMRTARQILEDAARQLAKKSKSTA